LLAYVYSRENPNDAHLAKVLTEDEARRITSNIAKLPTCSQGELTMSALAQALSVLVIGGIGAYIAWRQWRTAHDKIKLDLFDRRLAAYQRLKDAVAPIAASGKVTTEDTDRFARAMHDMRFLFDKETETCVDQIYRAMLDKHTIDAQLERTRARNKEKALLKSSELFKRITDGVYMEVPERLERFMHFSR
jgi:hypothetical protein